LDLGFGIWDLGFGIWKNTRSIGTEAAGIYDLITTFTYAIPVYPESFPVSTAKGLWSSRRIPGF
jgi:hypothetical protein